MSRVKGDNSHPSRDRLLILPFGMDGSSHRGFTFQSYCPDGPRTDKRALRATRGRITLYVEVSEGKLPRERSGWHLRDILRYEINRLLDPATLRHVDHLN